jgi:aerobic C4-dicarboxylate transport protein
MDHAALWVNVAQLIVAIIALAASIVATLDAKAVADYAGAAKAQTTTQFLLHFIPTTIVDAFARGDILQAVFISVLLGIALAMMRIRAEPLIRRLDVLT